MSQNPTTTPSIKQMVLIDHTSSVSELHASFKSRERTTLRLRFFRHRLVSSKIDLSFSVVLLDNTCVKYFSTDNVFC